jgi:hypothetical protein
MQCNATGFVKKVGLIKETRHLFLLSLHILEEGIKKNP